ncbi:MAG: peptidyl-prolyl cis-trans isomerase [Sedimentisphaerales bacterium]|nr:peptidyl-prolyl cis-trans isomerase [Sedimentisphaerales bacterium]
MKKSFVIVLFAASLLITGCTPNEQTQSIQEQPTYNNVNIERNIVSIGNKVKLQTSMGDIVIELDAEKAPITVKNFLGYVSDGFYDGLIFHRVIKGFMVQGGGFTPDMDQKDTNAPIKIESSNGLENDRGTIAMARTSVPDSATSQFFINHADNSFLNYAGAGNPGYAVFGKVIEGMDVVDKIAEVKTTRRSGMDDVPVELVIIESVVIVEE